MRFVEFFGVRTRVLALVAAFLLVLGGALNPAAAQQAAMSAATQQKIDQLAKLLDDPDIHAVLTARAKETVPSAAMPESMSANDFTLWINRIRAHLLSVTQAVPLVPGEFEKAADTTMAEIDGRRPIGVFLFFLLLVAIGRAAEWIFGRIVRRIHAGRATAHPAAQANGFHALGRHIFAELAPLVVFGFASIGLFLSFTWPELLTKLIVPTLLAVIAARFFIRILNVLLTAYPDASGEPAKRLVPVGDDAAKFWQSRIALFFSIFFVGWAANGAMMALGFLPAVREVIVYAVGIGLLATAINMVWRRPRGAERQGRSGAFEWLLTFWFCLIWLLWVSGAYLLMWICAYLILVPLGLKIVSSVVHTAFRRHSSDEGRDSPFFEVLIERSARAAFIAVAVLWLATVMRVNSTMMMQEETASRILRGALSGVVILLAADIVWQMVKALINYRLDRARHAEGDPAELARSGRLLTLLPIFRNFLAVIIATIAVLMVLSGLGIAVGPLIAGAGIFGVAIGFGSQTLVKDVISGIFYMTDDAFRVGEYIQSGSYKGTVESFSIRSVRLRHHRGPVFTVPFGVLGAVQNMSRDWAIDKFVISVSFQTDLPKVKKLVKAVGAELLEDPDVGSQIIETVKMKGVEQFTDYGINLSFAMTTKPGHQSGIRRRAYAMIREAFIANGIEFASPTVQVAGDDHGGTKSADATATAAALATNTAIAQKKAAEAQAQAG